MTVINIGDLKYAVNKSYSVFIDTTKLDSDEEDSAPVFSSSFAPKQTEKIPSKTVAAKKGTYSPVSKSICLNLISSTFALSVHIFRVGTLHSFILNLVKFSVGCELLPPP